MTTWSFTGPSLPTGATLTRSSNGFYQNSTGGLAQATTNGPRFEYVSGSDLGLLYEPAGTNYFNYSTGLNSSGYWSPFDYVTQTDNYSVAPDGTTTSTYLAIGTDTGLDRGTISGTTSASGNVIFSIFVKAVELSCLWLGVGPYTGFSNQFSAAFSVVAGSGAVLSNSATSGTTNYGATIQAYGNNWYRCSVAGYDPTGSYQSYLVFGANGTATDHTSSSGGLTVWGAMLEQTNTSIIPTSYIPTNGSSNNRATDALSINVPSDGTNELFITFDDNSTQTLTGVSAGATSIPTTINRSHIKSVASGVIAPPNTFFYIRSNNIGNLGGFRFL